MAYSREELMTGIRSAAEAGDNAAANEMAALLDSMPEEGPGFLERSQETLTQGLSDAMSSLAGDSFTTEGDPIDLDPASRVQKAVAGDILGSLGEVAGDALITGGKAVLPQSTQNTISSGMKSLAESAPAKAIGSGLEAASEAIGPEASRRVGELANVAALLAPSPKIPRAHFGTKAAARKEAGLKNDREDLVAKMIEPDNMDGPGDIITEGPLKTKKYVPRPHELEVIEEVSKVPGVKPKGNFTDNYGAVQVQVEKFRKQLDADLVGTTPIPFHKINTKLEEAIKELDRSPLFVGDPGVAAKKVYDEFARRVQEVGKDRRISPGDLLQIRRDIDKWLTVDKSNIFEANAGAAGKAATRLRAVINDIVSEAAPSAKVKDSLKKQSQLLGAMDTMRPRMVAERSNAMGRIIKSLEGDTGVHQPTTPLGIKANVSSVPVAIAAAVVAGGWGISKALNKSSRKAYTNLLRLTEAAINRGGIGVEQLKLDKAVLLSILNQEDE